MMFHRERATRSFTLPWRGRVGELRAQREARRGGVSLRVRPNSLSQISMSYEKRGMEIFAELGAFAFHPGMLRM
jgi:hypothetical protein